MSYLIKPVAFLCIIMLGYMMKRTGMLKQEHSMVIMRVIMTITLPATVVTAFGGYERNVSLLILVAFGFAITFMSYMVMFLLTRRVPKKTRIDYVISANGYNIGCFALPLIQSFYGPVGAIASVMFDIGNSVMVTSGSEAFTSVLLQTDGKGVSIKALVKKFFSSIPLDTYIIMFILSLVGFKLPEQVVTFLSPMAGANACLAMLMLGLLFSPGNDIRQWKDTAVILGFRYAVGILLSILVIPHLPFDIVIRHTMTLIMFGPIGALSPGFIERCHGDSESAAFTNSISAILGLIIMSVLVGIWQ